MNIAQKILAVESTLKEINSKIFVVQSNRIDASVDYAIRHIEIKESTDIQEIDVLEIELDLISSDLSNLIEEQTYLRVIFDNLVESLENI